MATLYDFLNSFFQNSWSQRFAKVRLTGKYNYKYLHHTHISGGNEISRICENEYTQIFQYRHYYTFLPYTKNSESDSFTIHLLSMYILHSRPFSLHFGVWTPIHPLEILSKKGRASLLIRSKDNSKVSPPFKTFNFSDDMKNCVRLQVFLKIENAVSKIDKLWKSMLFLIEKFSFYSIKILSYTSFHKV